MAPKKLTNQLEKIFLKGIVECPLAISIVISYDVIANKVEYAGINILLIICAFSAADEVRRAKAITFVRMHVCVCVCITFFRIFS